MSSLPVPQQSRVASVLSEQREAAREQLAAAWQLQISRIEDLLHAGWKEHLALIFEERFEELAKRLAAEFAAELEEARRRASEDFNRAMRRITRPADQQEWAAAVLEATAPFAPRTAIFMVDDRNVRGVCARGIGAIAGLEMPVPPAFATVLRTQEPATAPRTAAELSDLAALLDNPEADSMCHLFPVTAMGRVAAVVYAEGDEIDLNGLEAVAALAGAGLRPASEKPSPTLPDWAQLSPQEQELHLRAQRFARVRVAEMQLYKSQAVRAGRSQKNLYAALKPEIDAARETFRREFTAASPAMPDYFHLELIRTLANNDVAVLGEDYPGPLF
ncbi:MAG TPA: hypothetical protein PKW45_05195 [Bryobacteraceae bacterium]|nr:hypothetical protein [Bryobacteraceae bacterium]